MAGFISKEKRNGILTDIVAIVKRKYQKTSYGISCLLWLLECLSFFLFTCGVICSLPWSLGSFYGKEPGIIVRSSKPRTNYTTPFFTVGVGQSLDLASPPFLHQTDITFQSSVLPGDVVSEPKTVSVLYPLTFRL